MIIFICFLIASVLFSSPNVRGENIDPLTDQNVIDEAWIDYMIKAPAAINLLGQIMVVASAKDISLENKSSNHVYKYIKYPKSFRATLLQISNGIFD